MSYTTPTILKSVAAAVVAFIGAAVAAAGGPDLSHLQVDQWFEAITPGLVAALALLHQPDKQPEGNDKAVTTVSEVATSAADAHALLTDAAVASIKKVQASVGDLVAALPSSDVQRAAAALNGPGPLTAQVIASASS